MTAKNIFTGFVMSMAVDKISFTSRINFVNTKTFEKFRRGTYIDFRKDLNFECSQNAKNPWFAKIVRSDVVKADEFYTDEIRTCSAGGVIDSKTGQCAGFHFYDCAENSENTDNMLKIIFSLVPNPDRALILGSKKLRFSNYSIPVFEEILKGLKSKIDNVTIFREHIFPYSESDLHYNLKNDTWTIRSMFRYPTDLVHDHEVIDPQKLEQCFKEIKIAEGDSINFIKE